MGLLRSAGLMAANGFWTPPGNFIYIYRISCNQTGHYYIGQTGDLKTRVYDHYIGVIDEATGISYKENLRQHWQSEVGKILKALYVPSKKQRVELFILKSLSVSVLAIAGDREAANVLEAHYISSGMPNDLCLNGGVRPYFGASKAQGLIPLETLVSFPNKA